jgi:uncharacterized protein DUF3990
MATASSSFTPSNWTNQLLTLYHGTLDTHVPSILTAVNLNHGRAHTDFGKGFYTTTIEMQARAWAWQLSQRSPGSLPAVIRFDVDRDSLATLACLWFVRGSFNADDFWSLVYHCRRGGGSHARGTNQGWYDVVIGPVAASWRQRLSIYDADQISFHTPGAENLLNSSNRRRVP